MLNWLNRLTLWLGLPRRLILARLPPGVHESGLSATGKNKLLGLNERTGDLHGSLPGRLVVMKINIFSVNFWYLFSLRRRAPDAWKLREMRKSGACKANVDGAIDKVTFNTFADSHL